MSSFEQHPVGTVTLIRQPEITVIEDVVAVLPFGVAFHNDLVMVPVYAHVIYSVATFSMFCNVSDGLMFETENIVINSKWNNETRQQRPTDISIVAMLRDPSDVTDHPVTREVLFTLGIRVVSSAPTSQKQNFSCSVLYISHILNEKVQLRNAVTPQPATVIDYFDNDRFMGEIQIELSRPLAIFPYTQQFHLINTAYFTGIEVSVPVQVLVIYQSGSITFSTPDNCTPLTDSLSMNTLCNRAILNGSETHGDKSAIVILEYKGLVTNITFRVWFPDSPIELVSTPANLSAIEGWMDEGLPTNNCVQQYQRGKLLAFANFTYSENSTCRFEVNIFSIIQSQLMSSNDSVVTISDDGILIGLQPGECQISAGVNILPLTVYVLSDSVQVESSLNAVLATGISLHLPGDPYEVLSTENASAFLLQDFNTDGAKISVIPGIVLSDGTQFIPTEDIIVSSLNQTILRVVEGSTDVIVLGSGIAVLQVTWSPECNSSNLASTDVVVTIELADPSHIDISLDYSRITPSGSLASRADVPVMASLQAFLVYPDGTRADIINDGRLQLDLTQANGLINYNISNNKVIITAVGGVESSGVATVMVNVLGHTITTQFNITVVNYRSLLMYATPYPAYSGSETIRVSQLYQIANTGMYQQALLHMFMTLTDDSTVELVSSIYLYYESQNDSVSVSGNRVTCRTPGRVMITGYFGDQSTVIEVTVTTTPVVIISFIEFTLGTDTLSGIKNIHMVQFQVTALFNDSTIHNELLSGNTALYPGLLMFASDALSAALVTPSTGVVTLRDNYHDFVTVTVETVLSTASETFKFACNLVADDGDVDIGYQTGIPIPPQTVGASFNLPIYVNTGGQRLQSFDLTMLIEPNVLQFESGTSGTDFNSSRLSVEEFNQNRLSISGTGTCGSECDTQLIHIVDLNFTAVNASLVMISGQIMSLNTDDGVVNTGRSFIAGNIEILITEEGMRRRRAVSNSHANTHRTIKRQTTCQVAGDLNTDCVFDVNDAQYLLKYLAEETYDFQLPSFNPPSSQLSELDVDKNGVVDLSDAYVLERVSLNLLHLLTNVTVIPVQHSADCTLTVSASFVSQDTANIGLLVFFDFSVPFDRSLTSQQQFDDSVFEQGRHIINGKNNPFVQGGIVMGEYVNDGQYITRMRTDLVLNNITLNVLQVNQNAGQQSSVSPSRVQPMFGFPDPPFEYQPFEYDLPTDAGTTSVPVTYGFNPFMTFNNLLSTTACINASGIVPSLVFNSVNYTTSVDENQDIDTYVITVLAETETIYTIQYTITSGNEMEYFAIDEMTGNITTNSMLDAESSVTEFTLTITASLLGTEPIVSSNASVFIIVTDVNELPVISPPGNIEIDVTAPINSTVVELVITDPDTSTANFSTLNITDTLPDTSIFAIIGNTIVVSEHLASGPSVNYIVNVTVTDVADSSLFTTTSLSITIVNITAPYFDMTVYIVNVLESTQVGDDLTTIKIIAPLGSNITYTILNFSDLFAVDEQSGQLILSQNLEQSNYQFVTEAMVTISGEINTINATVEVTVQPNTTNGTVQFTMDIYNATIPEGSDNGTDVVQVGAIIGNSSSTMITYSLINSSVPFDINMTTGMIVVDGLLDYELVPSYTLAVTAMGPAGTFDIALVIINITNINDNPPSIQPHPSRNIEIDVTASINSTIVELVITDPDTSSADFSTLNITNTLPDTSIFAIIGNTIVVSEHLASGPSVNYIVNVTVTDVADSSLFTTTSLSITIVNITAPYFDMTVYIVNVSESTQVGDNLITVNVTAPVGSNITYTILNSSNSFTIDEQSGQLMLAQSLERSNYQFVIEAMVTISGEINTINATVEVTVQRNTTNGTVQFTMDIYNATIPEGSDNGTDVVQVGATIGNSSSTMITYSLINSSVPFDINMTTGMIVVDGLLDYELITSYTLVVTAMGPAGASDIASVIINITNINDNPPSIQPHPSGNVEIDVTAPINSTVVELVITDPDTSSADFSTLNITDTLPDTSIFAIIGNTIVVSEHLASGPSVDYIVNVTVTDVADSSLFTTTSLSITIVNITAPYFDMNVYIVNVLESTQVGDDLTTVNVTAPLGSNITYTILNSSNPFAVDEQSGQLMLAQSLEQSNYRFVIEATVTISGEINTINATVEVTVQRNTTNGTVQFTMDIYNATIPEGSDNGIDVVQVGATIGNSSSTMITYSLINSSVPFDINMTTGMIVVDGLLDYELITSYTLVVTAMGPAGTSDMASVIINITNINDNPPSIHPIHSPIIILSDVTQGSNITSVQSTDTDGNEDLRYVLTDNMIADINNRTGVITSNNITESSAGMVYTLPVTVTDGQFNDTTNLTILVLNPIYNIAIPEYQSTNQPILTLADRAIDGIMYHSVQLPEEFMLNATTGALYQNDTLENSTYQLIINVVSSTTQLVEVIVNITVIRNNSVPMFSDDTYQISLRVNAPIGAEVIQVNATDVDINDKLVYSIDSNYTFIANIDPLTGIVNTTECLPSAIQGFVITIEVSVTDGQLSGMAKLNISITSPVGTTSCDQLNFTSEVDIEYNINGGGFLVSTDQRQSRLAYSQLFSFLTEQSGRLTVRVGNKEDSTNFQPQRLMGETVTAILLNDVVYHDDPVIKVALQVRDVRYSTNVLPTTVQIQVTHTINGNINRSCTANAPMGTCVAEATLPDWFTTAANISVRYGIVGNSNTMQYLGSVQVIPRVSYTVNYTVAIIAPARPLYREQQFTIPVVAHAGFAVQYYQLVMTIPVGIMWNEITVDDSQWFLSQLSFLYNQDGSVTVSFLATLLIDVAMTVTREMVMDPTDLAEVTLTVRSDAAENSEYRINCTVIQLTNIFEPVLVNNAPPVALWVTRNGIKMQTGTIYVASDSVMGLFAYSSQSELVHLHTGMQYDVNLLTVRAMGGLQPANSTFCNSSNEGILNVTNNCSTVVLTTNQTEPVHLVNITLSTDDSQVTTLPFKIWFPVNYFLLVSDNILSPISGWLNAGANCTPVYQRSRVRVECVFTDGERSSEAVDVTAYVTSSLQVLNTSIAEYQDGYITGIMAGDTTLVLENNGMILARSNITVNSNPVDILSLDATAVVSISLMSPSSVALYGTHSVSVSITDVLEFEGVQAYLAVTALLSDSTRFPLKDAPGLLINSLDTNVIIVNGSGSFLVQAGRNSGSQELIEVTITSQNCSSDPLVFSETEFVNVSLPRPIGVSISPSISQLTKESDAARFIGIQTSTSVRVFLIFGGGRTQEMTTDDRTMYNVSSGLNRTLVGNDVIITANPNSASGEETITVTFSHVNLSTTASIQIIQAIDVELEAHPFPHYPGSNEYITATLYPIANISLWEQAVITARLLLSDNTKSDISTNPNLMLRLNLTPPNLVANLSGNHILNIHSTAAAGSVEVVGIFGNTNSSWPLRINVSTVPVVVRSIDHVYLSSGKDYIAGIRDIGSDQVIVTITLNDSTRYVDLFRTGIRLLPQLLQFATDNTNVLSVNQSTGSLTLHNNSRTLQTITVTAPASNVSHSGLQVACNLDPAVGDVDLGRPTGLPLDPFTTQSTVNIPVYINAGSVGVASLDIDVIYPSDMLRAQGVTLSSLTSTNPFVSRINDPPGVVALGGTLDGIMARNTILIATLHFEVDEQPSGTVEFTGNIGTFHDINGMLIGEGGTFVAGNVEADIVSSKRRRTVQYTIPPSPAVTPRRSRRETCDDPPCSSCPDGRDVGDTNFDCALNVQDVTFTRIYITEAPLNFAGSLSHLLQNVSDDQRTVLDSDQNGVINIDDAYYLLRVVFGLLRFVNNYTIINHPPDCTLQINFILYSDSRTLTDGSDATKTSLGVLVASNNGSFQQAFDNTDLIDGQKLSLSTSTGLIGGIVMANFTGNGIYIVTFSRDVTQYGDIGISLVQITTDDLQVSNLVRQIFLRGRPSSPYTYPGRLEVAVENTNITLIASTGYNPLLLVNSSDECDISTTVTPTPTPTSTSTFSTTSIDTTTATIASSTSSILSISTTTLISSSFIATNLLTTTSVSMDTPSLLISVTPSSSSVVDTSSVATMTTSSVSSLSLVPTIISDTSSYLIPSSTMPLSATLFTPSATTPLSTVTPSSEIIPSSVTSTSSEVIPSSVTSTSTIHVESSILVTETLSRSVVASSTSTQTVSIPATSTATPTPSMTLQFPSITPTVVEGMNMKLLEQVTGNVTQGFTQDYGLLAASSETVTASLAGYQSQAIIEEDRNLATRFRATLLHHDNRVWRDRNNVLVAFQVHDDEWNTRVQLNTLINMLVTLENSSSSMMHTCHPDENSGMCVINVMFPLEWFDVSSVQQASLTYNTISIATLSLQPYASVTSSLDQVVVELPSQSIFVGETFTATAYAYTSFSVTGYTLIFETSPNIDILNISINSSVWNYDSASSNQRYSVAAFSNDPEGSPLSMERTLLLTLTLQATHQLSDVSFINGAVESLTTTRGPVVLNNLNSTSGPIVMWSRNEQSTIGMVDVVQERPLALYAVATTSQIVNTFVLNGVSKTSSVSLIAGYSTGELREVTNNLTCTSNNEMVISINSQCSTVSASSQQATYASVTIFYMNLSVNINFKIWFPQSPMQILLSDETLNLVDNVNCNISQKAIVTVLASFVSGDNITENVIVTDYVSSSITSMEPSIVNVDGTVVEGVTGGRTEICVERNGSTWGCTNISVSSDLVSVYDVTAIFVNDITISEDPVHNSLLINVGYLLEIDGDRAGVAAAVRYTDGSIFVLDDGEILLQSLNTALLETEGTDVISRNSGEVQLNVTWLPPGCATGVYSLINTSLSLQAPTSITISSPLVQNVQITSYSDAARHVGISTVQGIIVELTYANNRTQDVTTDNRTIYRPSNNVLVLNRDENGVSVTVNDNDMTSTSGVLTVSYIYLMTATKTHSFYGSPSRKACPNSPSLPTIH